ncbi:MAG: ATP-binding protein [Acidaminococcaceae bacterium]|jgi:Cdc6-like AAA superfamily ATPase|nr:ATP-binding protein [Acidaminococcaceae bacterium]
MQKNPWLPIGYNIIFGNKIKKLEYFGDDWQIFSGDETKFILVNKRLAEKWIATELINREQLINVKYGEEQFYVLIVAGNGYVFPMQDSIGPDSKTDAMAFATALKKTRNSVKDVSLHDAIYVEKYSLLLPTYSVSEGCDDATVLGTWLTDGVPISTKAFKRLASFSSWLTKTDLAEIVSAAGLEVPTEFSDLTNIIEENKKDSLGEKREKMIEGKQEKAERFMLPGRPLLENFFNDHIIDIVEHGERYSKLGIQFPSATILYGPPGCGKTYAAEKLVEFLDWPNYSIDSNSIGSPYIHATSKKIAEIFQKAIDNAPSVLLIDEMEAYVSNRENSSVSGTHHVEEVAEFLRRIPEAIEHKVLIIAMTNHLDMIDPAIRRRGRFDNLIEVGMPSRAEVESLVASVLTKIPKADNLDTSVLIEQMVGKPLSDTTYIIRETARIAAKDGKEKIDQESLDSILKTITDNKTKPSKKIGF